MILSNKYAISLRFPQTFDELLYRVTKWRQTRDSMYNLVYNLKPHQVIAINTASSSSQQTATFNNIINSTITTLNIIGKFFEGVSAYIPEYVTPESNFVNHQTISTDTPLEYAAGTNITFDIDNLHKGIINILKTYGQFYDFKNGDEKQRLWIMNSREDAFKAYDLMLNDYPIFTQIISNFQYPNPSLPDIQQTLTDILTEHPSPDNPNISLDSPELPPTFKMIYDFGLNILLYPKSTMFSNNNGRLPLNSLTTTGTFQIIYYPELVGENPQATPTGTVILDPVTNNSHSLVVDENNYNTWLYHEV